MDATDTVLEVVAETRARSFQRWFGALLGELLRGRRQNVRGSARERHRAREPRGIRAAVEVVAGVERPQLDPVVAPRDELAFEARARELLVDQRSPCGVRGRGEIIAERELRCCHDVSFVARWGYFRTRRERLRYERTARILYHPHFMARDDQTAHPLLRLLAYAKGHRGGLVLATIYSVLNKLLDLAPPALIGAA